MLSDVEDPYPTVAGAPATNGVGGALWNLVCHPFDTFVLRWNWKAASLSAALRAPIYLFTSIIYRHGSHRHSSWRSVLVAVLVEAVYSSAISGCYGAFTQALRNAEPTWLAGLLITVAMPALLQYADYAVHLAAGTPNLRTGVIASAIFALLSSLFNWYIMRRGALLVGDAGRSFASDMRRMPVLILNFLLEIPRRCIRYCRRLFQP